MSMSNINDGMCPWCHAIHFTPCPFIKSLEIMITQALIQAREEGMKEEAKNCNRHCQEAWKSAVKKCVDFVRNFTPNIRSHKVILIDRQGCADKLSELVKK